MNNERFCNEILHSTSDENNRNKLTKYMSFSLIALPIRFCYTDDLKINYSIIRIVSVTYFRLEYLFQNHIQIDFECV